MWTFAALQWCCRCWAALVKPRSEKSRSSGKNQRTQSHIIQNNTKHHGEKRLPKDSYNTERCIWLWTLVRVSLARPTSFVIGDVGTCFVLAWAVYKFVQQIDAHSLIALGNIDIPWHTPIFSIWGTFIKRGRGLSHTHAVQALDTGCFHHVVHSDNVWWLDPKTTNIYHAPKWPHGIAHHSSKHNSLETSSPYCGSNPHFGWLKPWHFCGFIFVV